MSSEGIKNLEGMRLFYKSINNSSSASAETRELQAIKGELQILNDSRALEEKVITNKTNSPYLPDQDFYYKEAIYNSNEETSWKEVKSYDQVHNKLLGLNLKKLNVI